jgi:hypothetical protein
MRIDKGGCMTDRLRVAKGTKVFNFLGGGMTAQEAIEMAQRGTDHFFENNHVKVQSMNTQFVVPQGDVEGYLFVVTVAVDWRY